MDILWRARVFFTPDGPRILGGLGLLCLNTVLGLLKPWPLALLVDFLTTGRLWPGLSWIGSDRYATTLVLMLVIIAVGHSALGAVQQSLVIGVGLRGLARVRERVFDLLLALSLRRVQGSQTGDLIYRSTWDVYAFQTLFTQGVFGFLSSTLGIAAMVVVMVQMSPSLTWIALGTIPFLLAVMRALGRRMTARSTRSQAADAAIASTVQQTLAHLPVIQSFTGEAVERARFGGQVQDARAARSEQHRLELLYLTAVGTILALGTTLIVHLGVGQVQSGVLSVGQMMVFVAYLAQLYEPLTQLSHLGATLSDARAGVRRVLDWMGEAAGDEASGSEEAATPSTQLKDWSLEVDRIDFGYTPDNRVLRNVCFRIESGQTVAIVGASGAGKSTLLQLVIRLLDPDQGTLRLGGVALQSLPRGWLRRQVAVVPQEPVLLPGTVAENIAYGRPDATREMIREAARKAFAIGFIDRLPQGMDTRVGEGAARLSVGEKQRINLARAFLKDAPVLLLDEPTSALDLASEQEVLKGLEELCRGRTVLIVAHRVATLDSVDRILELKDGCIRELSRGEHPRLAAGPQPDGCVAKS
jgi:ATP-binding cassette, subfamily B, bacterial